jgi:hypothetical protein
VTVNPVYEGCKAFGLNATIATTGCDYVYHFGTPTGSGWHVATDIGCSAGSTIKILTATCEVTIGPQSGLATSEATNSGRASPEAAMDIVLHTNITGIKPTVGKDGIGCPLSGAGSFSKGDYTGTTTVRAHNAVTGVAVGVTLGSPPLKLEVTGDQIGVNTLLLTNHLIGGSRRASNANRRNLR